MSNSRAKDTASRDTIRERLLENLLVEAGAGSGKTQMLAERMAAQGFGPALRPTAADVLAWVVLVMVPLIGIAVFWIVHVLPEKIAHKNHHPQTKAIQTLCLLSLVFGGLLWPIAWLWAFTRPVTYKPVSYTHLTLPTKRIV